jgi:hypothetical protein
MCRVASTGIHPRHPPDAGEAFRVGRSERLRASVLALCSDTCEGRAAGSSGGAAARAFLERELGQLGLEPLGESGYRQPVPGCAGTNLLARIPGNGPLSERAVLVAAHYDHLGRDGEDVFHGADDNAAAVAMVLELARELAVRQGELSRQVIVAFFDAEEPPHFFTENMGSVHFVNQPTFPVDRIDLMVCLDLVGHACGGRDLPPEVRGSLFVLGAELSRGTPELVDRLAARARGVCPRRLHADLIPPLSDYHAFWEAQVPFLFLTCGRWKHYHRPTDTPERLAWEKMTATTAFLIDLVTEASRRPERQVEWLADGRDDAATLRSLHDLTSLLLPTDPNLAPVVAQLDALARRGEPLRSEERLRLSLLVGRLETLFD